jgi:rhamnulokinase
VFHFQTPFQDLKLNHHAYSRGQPINSIAIPLFYSPSAAVGHGKCLQRGGFMNRYFIACGLGAETGRISLGQLQRDSLVVSEVHRFQNRPIEAEETLQWDVPALYHEVLQGLRAIASYEEPVESISFSSWGSDYMLFDSAGAVMAPTYHRADARAEEGMRKVLARVPLDVIYDETGVQPAPVNTLFQLASEKSKRLSKASHLMPVADGFNYLLTGVPRIEESTAGRTQLYNPVTRDWSDRLCHALSIPKSLFPPVVEAGTALGGLRPAIEKETGLSDTQVVASCSHDIAAALAGLPVQDGESWGYLCSGAWAVMGTETDAPIIEGASRDRQFTNEIGFQGKVNFHKHSTGLWLMKECQRVWEQEGRGLDGELLMHLAGSTPAFESLIDPADPGLMIPGDIPAKIQAFCRDTNQPVPRKPGPIVRCVMESLALSFRRTLDEMEALTGKKITRLYVMNGNASPLLNHFTANALNIPVVVLPADVTAIGNIVVQALATGHIQSLEQAHDLVRRSMKTQTILPHGNWQVPYARFLSLQERKAQ